MDNLFAVMSPYNHSNDVNTVTNSQLSSFFINNTPATSCELSEHGHFIYLTKYSNESSDFDDSAPLQKEKLSTPIIGNVRIDNKVDLAALCESKPSSISEQLIFKAYKKIGGN